MESRMNNEIWKWVEYRTFRYMAWPNKDSRDWALWQIWLKTNQRFLFIIIIFCNVSQFQINHHLYWCQGMKSGQAFVSLCKSLTYVSTFSVLTVYLGSFVSRSLGFSEVLLFVQNALKSLIPHTAMFGSTPVEASWRLKHIVLFVCLHAALGLLARLLRGISLNI